MLTEVIPGYLQWFWENWRDIFKTIYDYVSTVVKNMHENLVRFFTAVIEWFQGNGFNFEWKSLTEGFETSIKKLPEIAERELGPLEQDLKGRFEAIGNKVGDGLGAHIAKRLDDIPGFNKDIGNFFSGIGNKIKDFAGGAFGGGGGQRGSGQIETPDGESSRFLSGASAASQEQLMLEQLELQRIQAEAAQGTRENSTIMRQLLAGDIAGALKTLAANKAAKVVING
jgi:hypothetical protein